MQNRERSDQPTDSARNAHLGGKWDSRGTRKQDGHPLFRGGRCLPLESQLMATVDAFLFGLFDQRPSLLDTHPPQFRFNFGLLAGEQIYFGLKRSITWQLNLDPVFSWADQHGMKCSAQFAGMSQERVVHKHCCAWGEYVDFQGCGHVGTG